jgi:hypothetical protein
MGKTRRLPGRWLETYVSVDIESDGPIPGPNSMLSLGAVAITQDGRELGEFEVNFETLPGATQDPDTMNWWKGVPDAWKYARRNPQSPQDGMADFRHWVETQPGHPVMVGYPITFDFLFTHWYLHRFTGGTPFSHSGLDLKTAAMLLLGVGYRQASKRVWPKSWFLGGAPHTHRAVDDAREQGQELIAMLRERDLRHEERLSLLALS